MTDKIPFTNHHYHNLSDLLEVLHALAVTVAAQGERLHIEAPLGTVTPELRQTLTERKAGMLAHLTGATEPPAAAPEIVRIPLSLDYSPSDWLAARGLRIAGGTPYGPRGPLLYLADLAEGGHASQS